MLSSNSRWARSLKSHQRPTSHSWQSLLVTVISTDKIDDCRQKRWETCFLSSENKDPQRKIPNFPKKYKQFYSYLKSDCSLCVPRQRCVYLATGFLTLQVQLPVLRPHLRRGITAYYSSTNNSLSAHQPAGSQTQATEEEGVRGVTLAPGCANSRWVTFYQWLIHYLKNLLASRSFLLCPQVFSLSFRPSLSLSSLVFLGLMFRFVFVCACALNRAFISSTTFSAVSFEALSTEA